jgi:cytidylate kinase
MSTPRVIAIDGPAAAGKGTLARRLAEALGLPYLDTGLLYRAVARRVLEGSLSLDDPPAVEMAARSLKPSDLERTDLRVPEIDRMAARVASIPGVRAALLTFQRDFARSRGAVLDGRDIGTIIFPDAPAKFFVTAGVAARAHRRWDELRQCGLDVSFETIKQDMEARDAADASRAAAPLCPAPDAITLDTTDLDADQVFRQAMDSLRERGWHMSSAQQGPAG